MTSGNRWEKMARGVIYFGAIFYMVLFLLELTGVLRPTLLPAVAGLILASGYLLFAGCRMAGVIQSPASWSDSAWYNSVIGIFFLVASLYSLLRPHLADPTTSAFDNRDLGVSLVVTMSIVGIIEAVRWAGARRQNKKTTIDSDSPSHRP